MEIKNLYDSATYTETIDRVNKLSSDSHRRWGKMTVSQMLAHCKVAFNVPLSDKPLKGNFLLRLIGPAFKSQLYNDKQWKQGLPTSPDFVIKDERNFDTEKTELLDLVNKFYTLGPDKTGKYPHPVFGKFTSEQWGKSMWKHLDHHLRQFNA